MNNKIQKIFKLFISGCTVFFIVTALILVGLIFYVALPVFQTQGLYFLYGDVWNYEKKIYGIRIFIMGTLALTATTLVIAFPISLFTAIFLAEYAPKPVASILRPMIELLVGIPSVVYGIIGLFVLESVFANVIDPFLNTYLGFIPLFVDPGGGGNGVLLASTVLAIMILPTIITISEDSMHSVPYEYREASYALGANHWQTIKKVVLPAAFKGILLGAGLGMMRAMGETMAIVMLLGNISKVPGSLLDVGYAMTSKILNDIGFHLIYDSDRSALFGIAVILFLIEMIALSIFRKIGGRHV
jgi:phosphate transport system permease protein